MTTFNYALELLGSIPDKPHRTGGDIYSVSLYSETIEITILSLGATIKSMHYIREFNRIPLVWGFEDWKAYDDAAKNHYVGSTMGRWCRSIPASNVNINGIDYQLTEDTHGMHLHGGVAGFHSQLWDISVETGTDSITAVLTHTSPDGHQGYPGEIIAKVAYCLSNDSSLIVHYYAKSTKPTIFGLANHVYWRINDAPIDDYALLIPGNARLEFFNDHPTAESPIIVDNTEYDYRKLRQLYDQKIDSFFVLDKNITTGCKIKSTDAILHFDCSSSGLGVYTGDFDPIPRRGVCYEFGGWPGAERRSDFPSPFLQSAETYHEWWSLKVTSR